MIIQIQQLFSTLAKRWQTALLVHVDNDTLKKLQSNKEALKALMNIEGFRALNSDIQTIINRSEKVREAKKEKGDSLTAKEKKELTREEKEVKSLRKQVQENLLKLAARIPAFMYLTDYREQTIKDVITQIEPELFRKVTGLSVKDFDILCSIGLFDPEKMNQGIFGFRKYENSSLSYTGIDMHEGEAVGGWDTVLRRAEYDALYSKQQGSISDLPEMITTATAERPATIHIRQAEGASGAKVIGLSRNVKSVTEKRQEQKDWEEMLSGVKAGATVKHKAFGNGIIVWMDKAQKYIRVKFAFGEKQFIFPNAFIDGFLNLE